MSPVSLAEAESARARIAGIAIETPLIRYPTAASTSDADMEPAELHLKLENLQPIGSFKLRGAANAMMLAGRDAIADGVYTASAGNMAQGVAWCARTLGVRCQVVVPEHAPRAKTDAIERLGGSVHRVPFERWWQSLVEHGFPGMDGLFVHPFADRGVLAGNGTIALELRDQLEAPRRGAFEEIDAVIVPYGGGGLACGVASVMRALNPRTRVYAVEVETAAPLTASLAAGAPTPVVYTRTFTDGMGSGAVADEMWPLASTLLAGTIVVTVADVAKAVRVLAERAHVIAEGAGAAPLAAAMSGAFAGQRVVGVVSGGNIDAHRLSAILQGGVPD